MRKHRKSVERKRYHDPALKPKTEVSPKDEWFEAGNNWKMGKCDVQNCVQIWGQIRKRRNGKWLCLSHFVGDELGP
jgi:hypothetical protein